MKDKGFTLIELLGVIIILALLMIIVMPKIINSVKSSTNETDELTKELIYNASDLFVQENKSMFNKVNGNSYCITLQDLVGEGYLKSPIKLSDSEEDLTTLKSVQVNYNDGFTYELKNNDECVVKNDSVYPTYELLDLVKLPGITYVYNGESEPGYELEYTEWFVIDQDKDTVTLFSAYHVPVDSNASSSWNFVKELTDNGEGGYGFKECGLSGECYYEITNQIKNYKFYNYDTSVPTLEQFSKIITINEENFDFKDSLYQAKLNINSNVGSEGRGIFTMFKYRANDINWVFLNFYNNNIFYYNVESGSVVENLKLAFRPVISNVPKADIIE